MNAHARPSAIILGAVIMFALTAAAATTTHSQPVTVRRVTHTPGHSLSLNPTLSGDGRQITFESTASLAAAGPVAAAAFTAIRADISAETTGFTSLAASRAPAPALSQDGSSIAFASREDLVGSNADGNFEVFLFEGGRLRQITQTTPLDDTRRALDGNFQPSISDDGRRLAFSSNRDLTGANADGNREIFLYDITHRTFRQLTNSADDTASFNPKLSGDGALVALIKTPAPAGLGETAASDLVVVEVQTGSTRVLAAGVAGLSFTYGRAISDDGSRIVYAGEDRAGAVQVFLFDGRNNVVRQLTRLSRLASDVMPQPTISGDGSRVAFATRRRVSGSNPDGSVELYVYDLPTNSVTQITDAPAGAIAEIISSLDDDGQVIAFNFPRILSGAVGDAEFANNSEIYAAYPSARPPFTAALQVTHAATFGKEPSPNKVHAPGQIVFTRGTSLALATGQTARNSDGMFPFHFAGAQVLVNRRLAQLLYVSPTQVNFQIPEETELGAAEIEVRNHDGYPSRATVMIERAAPGVFAEGGDGAGAAVALDAETFLRSPFDPLDARDNARRLTIFTTGVRFARHVEVSIGGRQMVVEAVAPSPDLPGLDEVHVVLQSALAGAGVVPLVLRADGRDSNPTTIHLSGRRRAASLTLTPAGGSVGIGRTLQFTATARDADGQAIADAPISFTSAVPGVASVDANGLAKGLTAGTTEIIATAGDVSARSTLEVYPLSLVINEVLADPPDGIEGDSNLDGVRSATQDEFIEIVNASASDIDLGGYQILTGGLEGPGTLRHTFTIDTILAPGAAVVVFGAAETASFNPSHPAFAGAFILKATTGGLSLLNGGGIVVLRDSSGVEIERLTYGNAAGLAGDRNQSLTRAPDVVGAFALHQLLPTPARRAYSPGTRVDATPFSISVPVSRIEVEPATAAIIPGARQQFSARAFAADESELTGVRFRWQTSAPAVASIDNRGLALGLQSGTTVITASAPGVAGFVTSNAVTLQVNNPQPLVRRIEIAPAALSLNRGNSQQLTARAFDHHDQLVPAPVFSWSTSDANIIAVDAVGVCRAIGIGAATISASAPDGAGRTISAQAIITSLVPLVINEILADVAPDNPATPTVEGDANRDGARNADDDEFLELFNNSAASLDLSSIVIADASNNRFTFPSGATLAAGQSAVVFGGGVPPASDPVFGGALIFTTNSLGLNDSGDTVSVKLPQPNTEILLAAQSYGSASPNGPPAPSDQSLTRAPEADTNSAGEFVPHSSGPNAASRVFSPGTRADGTPFGAHPVTRIEVTPANATVEQGATQVFSARAFALVGETEREMPLVSFAWDSGDRSIATVNSASGAFTTATGITAGTVTIRARAGGREATAILMINSPPPVFSRVELSPPTALVVAGDAQQFTARAFDQYGQPFGGVTFAFASGDPNVALVGTVVAGQDQSAATVTINGINLGVSEIMATGSVGALAVLSHPARLIVTAPPPALTRIEVSPAETTVSLGATRQFMARGFDQHNQELTGITFTWTTSDPNVAGVDQNGLATGLRVGTASIRATVGQVSSNGASLQVTPPSLPAPGHLIVNEAVVSFSASSAQPRADFVELYNTTEQTLDISGLRISFRPGGSGNAARTVTLPGAPGSAMTLVRPRAYFLVINGSQTFGASIETSHGIADGFDAGTFNSQTNYFDLNNTTGGIIIELDSVKLDGLTYQGGSAAPAPPFNSYGEGSLLIFPGGATNDLIRTPNAADTNHNATDFRRNGSTASVTPKAANP